MDNPTLLVDLHPRQESANDNKRSTRPDRTETKTCRPPRAANGVPVNHHTANVHGGVSTAKEDEFEVVETPSGKRAILKFTLQAKKRSVWTLPRRLRRSWRKPWHRPCLPVHSGRMLRRTLDGWSTMTCDASSHAPPGLEVGCVAMANVEVVGWPRSHRHAFHAWRHAFAREASREAARPRHRGPTETCRRRRQFETRRHPQAVQ